jgi:uridine kinase
MDDIIVTFPGGKRIPLSTGTKFCEFINNYFEKSDKNFAAVRVNNKIFDLSSEVRFSSNIEPIMLESNEGAVIYRNTISFILCAAVKQVFPDRILHIGYSLNNSYYFYFYNGKVPLQDDINLLKDAINSFIKQDLIIERKKLSFNDAVNYFKNANRQETASLLEQNAKLSVEVNSFCDYMDVYISPLLPRTGLLSLFDIVKYSDGFLLCYPVFNNGNFILNEFEDLPGIFSVFYESKKWSRMTGVSSISHLNNLVIGGDERGGGGIKNFIRITEAFADKNLFRIAEKIYQDRENIKLITVAGPSSSGKTTTVKRLAIQLNTLGINTVIMSLDDYYLNSDLVPKDEKGEPDFECLESLDVSFLNKQLLDFFAGKEITLPSYDFKTETRRNGKCICLDRRTILILEGIHGLNDALTVEIPRINKFKLYVSALTPINIDDHNRIATSDNRLLRRLVRDYQFRGLTAQCTLHMWPNVQRGAKKYIFSFQNNADAVFNSALSYEISVLKSYAEPLLHSVSPNNFEFSEASRLLNVLSKFYAITPEYVPPLSILREFIGNSDFKY